MSDALAACPFCGGEARPNYIRDGRQVRCGCGAGGPWEFNGRTDQPSANDRAIAAWNRRPHPVGVEQEPVAWQWRAHNSQHWVTELREHLARYQLEHFGGGEARPLYAAPLPTPSSPDVLVERLTKALRECQGVLALLTDGKAVARTDGLNIMSAYAQCVAAEANARSVLSEAP